MERMIVKCLLGSLIFIAGIKFADILFLHMEKGALQLAREGVFFFVFIMCFEFLRERIKTHRSSNNNQ